MRFTPTPNLGEEGGEKGHLPWGPFGSLPSLTPGLPFIQPRPLLVETEGEYSQSTWRLPRSAPNLRGSPEAQNGEEGTAQFPNLLQQSLSDPELQGMKHPDTTLVPSPHFPALGAEARTRSEVADHGCVPGMFAQGQKAGLSACRVKFQGV